MGETRLGHLLSSKLLRPRYSPSVTTRARQTFRRFNNRASSAQRRAIDGIARLFQRAGKLLRQPSLILDHQSFPKKLLAYYSIL
jgi:hypothetical protein